MEGPVRGSGKYDASKRGRDSGEKRRIMRCTNDCYVDGFRKPGFDSKDSNSWSKLLPFLKKQLRLLTVQKDRVL